MWKIFFRFGKIIAALIMFLLAIIGFLIPFGVPGFPFLFAGIILLSPKHGKKLIEKIKYYFRKYIQKKTTN